MNKKVFLTNKYTISVFILLVCLAVDIILHRGMSRVIIPSSFTDSRQPKNFRACPNTLVTTSKDWIKGLNKPEYFQYADKQTGGFETDVYFDSEINNFRIYHDTTVYSRLTIDFILDSLKRFPKAGLWLDFKNLDNSNKDSALKLLVDLREKFSLKNRMIIESSSPHLLAGFCAANFFTSYYVPYFNPYSLNETELAARLDSISSNLSNYPVSALSGYYFQYPALKKYFPGFPILTWTTSSSFSVVSGVFNNRLENDDDIKVILYPLKIK